MTNEALRWRPISLLPTFAEEICHVAESAHDQAGHLRRAYHGPDLIDEDELARMQRVYEKSENLMTLSREQVRRWRSEQPTADEVIMLDHLEVVIARWTLDTKDIIRAVKAMMADQQPFTNRTRRRAGETSV